LEVFVVIVVDFLGQFIWTALVLVQLGCWRPQSKCCLPKTKCGGQGCWLRIRYASYRRRYAVAACYYQTVKKQLVPGLRWARVAIQVEKVQFTGLKYNVQLYGVQLYGCIGKSQ